MLCAPSSFIPYAQDSPNYLFKFLNLPPDKSEAPHCRLVNNWYYPLMCVQFVPLPPLLNNKEASL